VTQELKRKGVTLTLLWQEYRTAHPDGYRYTWFCDKFAVHQRRANPTFRHSHKVEGAVLIVERWISARLRHRRFFNLADLNGAIGGLLEELNDRPMRHVGKSRRQLFEEIEREALAPLPSEPFEYAEWKTAKVHPDYHVDRPSDGRAAHLSGCRDLPGSHACQAALQPDTDASLLGCPRSAVSMSGDQNGLLKQAW
jgi:hypothetical protein